MPPGRPGAAWLGGGVGAQVAQAGQRAAQQAARARGADGIAQAQQQGGPVARRCWACRSSSCRRRDLPMPGGPTTSTARGLALVDAGAQGQLQHAQLVLAPHAGGGPAEQAAAGIDRGVLPGQQEQAPRPPRPGVVRKRASSRPAVTSSSQNRPAGPLGRGARSRLPGAVDRLADVGPARWGCRVRWRARSPSRAGCSCRRSAQRAARAARSVAAPPRCARVITTVPSASRLQLGAVGGDVGSSGLGRRRAVAAPAEQAGPRRGSPGSR